MSKRFFYILVLLCLLVTPPLRAQWGRTDGDSWVNTDYNTTEGTDFWLTFMFNYGNTEDDIIDLHLRVFATARQNARVTVHYADGTSESFNVKAFSRAQHDIDIGKGYVIREKEVERKGIHVTSTVPISLYAVSQNAEAGSQDATNVLPTKALQKEYVIQTYGTDGVSTEFALVATKYVSNITINVKKTHNTNPSRNSEDIVQTGAMYPGDVYLYRSNGANYSLSGTQICSNVPIAVFVGGQHADIPIRTSNKNHIYSQAMPTDMWGKIFVATKTYGQRWDYLRFTAAENNTALSVYDGATNSYTTITPSPLSPLDTYQDSIYSPNSGAMTKVYKTNKAVETFLYMTDFTMNSTGVTPDGVILGEGSPAMAPIAPMEQGLKSLVFTTLDAQNIQNHYVNIATYYDSRNNIQLDNTNIGHLFKRISGTPYAFLDMPIDTGAHILVNTNPRDIHGIFTAHVYGLGQPADGTRRESYAYSAGSRIERSIDMLIDGQYIKQKDVCIPNTTIFTPVINQDFINYHWQFYPANPSSTVISSGDYTTIRDYTVQLPDTGRWDVSLIVNYSTPLCANIITDTVKAIINMHDTVHIDRGYNDQQARNICYGEDFYVHYERGITYNYVADSSTVQHIFGKNTKFELNKEYIFKDTLENKWGCDSIIWQHVIIRPTYDTIIFDTTCYQHLPYEWRRQDNGVLIKRLTKNDLYNKHNLHLTGESLFKVDSIITTKENLRTRYGCDSLVALKLLVMPDYLIDDGSDQACQDSIYGYNWSSSNNPKHKHTDANGKVLTGHRNLWMQKVGTNKKVHILPGQYISLKTPGTYTLVDSLKTSHVCRSCDDAAGCDSVHIKTIVIQERKQKILPELDLCDNHYIVALNDTLCVGYKYKGTIPEPWRSANRYIVVNKDITLVNHSSTQDVLQCDSITMQQVHLCQSFESNPIVVSLCQGTDKYDWKRADNGKIIQSITIPSSDHYPVSFNYTDTLTTSGHCNCDSIVHLTLTINPTYDTTLYDTICDVSLPYKWIVHDNSTNKDRTISISRPSSETSNVWHTTHQETLHTKKGCDSIVHLDLIVYPTVRTNVPIALCPEQLPYQYCENGATVPVGYNGGTKTETLASHQFPMSCDSIVTYHISVSAENVIDIPVRRCDDDLPYEYVYPTLPSNATHTRLLTDIRETGIYLDTVSIEGQCRTIYRLNFTVDKTYDDTLNLVNVCVNNLPYAWKVKDKKGNSRTISINIPGNKVLPFDTLCTANLKSIHDCDSIVHLPLRINPIYNNDTTIKICDVEADGFIYSFGKDKYVFNRHSDLDHQHILRIDTGLLTPSSALCDSAMRLHLIVYPSYKIDSVRTICEGDSTWWQGSWRKGKLQSRVEGASFPELGPTEYVSDYYERHYSALNACDSLHTLTLMVLPRRYTHIDTAMCDYENYRFGDRVHTHEHGVYYDTLRLQTIGNKSCDSIVTLRLTVYESYHRDTTIKICDVEADGFIYSFGKDKYVFNRHSDLDHQHILRIDTGLLTPSSALCDSAMRLHLIVYPSYKIDSVRTICEGDSTWWQGSWRKGKLQSRVEGASFPELGPTEYVSDYYERHYSALNACDSLHTLTLNVIPRRYTHIDTAICDYEYYIFGTTRHVHARGVYYDTLHLQTTTAPQCDSIVTLKLTVHESYHRDTTIKICDTEADYFVYNFGIKEYRFDRQDLIDHQTVLYIDTVLTTPSSQQCDSAIVLHLIVAPTYDFYETLPLCENDSLSWQGMLFVGNQYEAYGKTYSEVGFDSTRIVSHGTYNIDIRRTTILACDSTYHLTLHVNEVAHVDWIDSVCQNHSFHNPNWNWGEGKDMDTRKVGTYVSVDTIHSPITACDSIITLTLRVDSVYDYRPYFEFCQDRTATSEVVNWTDDAGNTRTFTLDISAADTFSYIEPHTSIHGCDSTYGVTWIVHPTYYFYDTLHICEDGYTEWQNTRFTGDSLRNMSAADSIILKPGIYHEFRHYETTALCDSDYYATIYVHPIYDTLSSITVCESDGFIWHQDERPHGEYRTYADTIIPVAYCDTIRLLPYEADMPQPRRDTVMRYSTRLLQTVDGCDSLSRLALTVQPTYFFLTDTTICSNDRVKYRGKYFSSRDTIYTDHQYTEDRCDSIYQLRLHVRPIFMNVRRVTMCDNETLYHPSLNNNDVVWEPGNEIRDSIWEYYDMIYTDKDGCDSIYRYYLTIHKSHHFYDTATICSNESYVTERHTYTGYEFEYDTNLSMMPYDTTIVNRYATIHGCDSVYKLTATIKPAYRHRDTITICDNEEIDWRGFHYQGNKFGNVLGNGYPKGEHIFYDSLKTAIHDCDSIYELHLMVQPTYRKDTAITKCENDDLTWRSFNLNNVAVGHHFYYDSLTTVQYGCDSVYHLYLTVNPVVDTVCYDTICFGETYYYGNKTAHEDGIYRDTITSERYGCDSIILAYLEVIEPTVPTAWADSICADDDAYDLFYTYTGDYDPIRYSVKYDEEGHRNGFEDIIDQPITSPDELSWLRLPMPNVKEDRTNYPKPNYYNITLILDNGKCKDPEKWCSTDTSIVLSYPSWITRQRFGDVIALYNEKYNGGYQWWHYQWYHGNELLPGETHEYLYVPTGLVVGDQYHVRLTREGEVQDFQTCPITIVADPIYNDFAPNMGYLSVVPTCVCSCNPYINILSRKDGTYRITTSQGIYVTDGVFRADVTKVEVPPVDDMYIVQLWSNDTPEEPYRSIKIIVSPKCVPELYENIPF